HCASDQASVALAAISRLSCSKLRRSQYVAAALVAERSLGQLEQGRGGGHQRLSIFKTHLPPLACKQNRLLLDRQGGKVSAVRCLRQVLRTLADRSELDSHFWSIAGRPPVSCSL